MKPIIYALGAAFLLLITNPVKEVFAGEHDGDPTLCGFNWGSGSSGSEGVLNILSRCDVIDLASFEAPNQEFTAFLEEMERELWGTGRLPKVLYHYTLVVSHDSGKNIELNLSNWEVIHSPYTWIAQSFVYNIPACSRLVLKFYSPWAPEIKGASINIGIRNETGEWHTIGAGQASLVTPVWFQYLTDHMRIEPLLADEAKTEACKSAR